MQTPSLHNFCQEFKKGNTKLFDGLFEDYYVNLCRFAFTYVKNTDTAEEIVQEMFITLWEQREQLDINTSIRSFLYTSVKNRSLNYIRNEATRLRHENEHASEQFSKVSNIIDFCESDELNHLITESISELPDKCRQIFELSRNQNLTYNEIASQLNLSPKTVENQMGIALKQLRKKLSPYRSGQNPVRY